MVTIQMPKWLVAVGLSVILLVVVGFQYETRDGFEQNVDHQFQELSVTGTLTNWIVGKSTRIYCKLDSAATDDVRVGTILRVAATGSGMLLEPGDSITMYHISGGIINFIAEGAGGPELVWCFAEIRG